MGWALLALLVSGCWTLAMGAVVLAIVRAERTGAGLELLDRVVRVEERVDNLLDLVIEQEKRLAGHTFAAAYTTPRFEAVPVPWVPAPASTTVVPSPKEATHAGPERDQG